MEMLHPKLIVQQFLVLLLEEVKGEPISCCDNPPYTPFKDGTEGRFTATECVDDVRDQDLFLSMAEFSSLHLQKITKNMAAQLRKYIRSCPGCELLVFQAEKPGGMEWSERATSEGQLSVRLWRGYSIQENLKYTRFDVLFGIRAKRQAAEVAA